MDTQTVSLENTFEAALRERCGVRPGMRVLAAVSGGADSVALLRLLCRMREKMGISVCAAHFDHQLRGEASHADACFVEELCARMDVPYSEGTEDVRALAKVRKKGLEDAAREARYAFLYAQARATQADVIALAHHRDDQAETLLLHAVRGCDIRGLCAMRYRSGMLIRPLLDVAKEALEAYLSQQGQAYRVDQSNFAPEEADRNRIRLDVMPSLRMINSGVSTAFARLARSAQRDEAYFDRALDQLALPPFVPMPYGGFFETDALRDLPEALLSRAVIRDLEASRVQSPCTMSVEKTMALIGRSEGKAEIAGGARLVRSKARMHIVLAEDPPGEEAVLCLQGRTQRGEWTLIAREAQPGERGDGVYTQVLDAAYLEGAVLRACRPGDSFTPLGMTGDSFTPLGMTGAQKLKKTFQDAGVEQQLRAYVPLIAQGGQVLWLIGARPAQTAAVTAQTRRGIHLTFTGRIPFDMRKKEHH